MAINQPAAADISFIENASDSVFRDGFSLEDFLKHLRDDIEKISKQGTKSEQDDLINKYITPLNSALEALKTIDVSSVIKNPKANPAVQQILAIFSPKMEQQPSELERKILQVHIQYLEAIKKNKAKFGTKAIKIVIKGANLDEKLNKRIDKLIMGLKGLIPEQKSEESISRNPVPETLSVIPNAAKKPLIMATENTPKIETLAEQLSKMEVKIEAAKAKIDPIKPKPQTSTFSKITSTWNATFHSKSKSSPRFFNSQATQTLGGKNQNTMEFDQAKSLETFNNLQTLFNAFKEAVELIAKGKIDGKSLETARTAMEAFNVANNSLPGIQYQNSARISNLLDDSQVMYKTALKAGQRIQATSLFNEFIDHIDNIQNKGVAEIVNLANVYNNLIGMLESQEQTKDVLQEIQEVKGKFEKSINPILSELITKAKKDSNLSEINEVFENLDKMEQKLPKTTLNKLRDLHIEAEVTKLIDNAKPPLTISRKFSEKLNTLNPFKAKKNDLTEGNSTTLTLENKRKPK